MKKEFESNFNKINENFKFVYKRLFGGGNGELKIVDKNNILESDIEITAQPPGKKMKNLNLLSGGEKVRCMLSRMMLANANVLMLDQPTNHLDLESITALNNGLKDFTSNVLFASHDHQFIQTIANRIIDIKEDGSIVDKQTTYDEYLALA